MDTATALAAARIAIKLAPAVRSLVKSAGGTEPTTEDVEMSLFRAQVSGDKIDSVADEIRDRENQ